MHIPDLAVAVGIILFTSSESFMLLFTRPCQLILNTAINAAVAYSCLHSDRIVVVAQSFRAKTHRDCRVVLIACVYTRYRFLDLQETRQIITASAVIE